MRTLLASIAAADFLGGCGHIQPSHPAHHGATKSVYADAETAPIEVAEDVADDPAIWVHPTDPQQSLIIGTHKKGGGLEVYDLSGRRLQSLPDGAYNNVDLRYGMALEHGTVDIVAASNRTDDSLALYGIDPQSRTLYPIAARIIPTLEKSYGLCMYASDEATYVFVNGKDGRVVQLKLIASDGRVDATPVREFDVGTQTEGCVADDELGYLYIGEEEVGIWRYDARPDAPAHRVLIDSVASKHLSADVEGLALYTLDNGEGYLIASSQGDNSYVVYKRTDGSYLGRFRVVDGAVDGTSETDGIDVTSAPIGSLFPNGLMVVQDGADAPSGFQNFKLIRMERILDALELNK
jgi:3-phytase